MANAEEVFATVSAALGTRIKRLPDGETGERRDWITWLEPVFADNPAFAKSGEFFRVHASGTGRERYTLRDAVAPQDVRFDNLFYADIAKDSYAIFRRLKEAGKIPAGTKFQVDLVPAHSVIWLFLVDALHAPLDPIYNDAVKREIDKIAAAIPHDELAIQFDVASAVFARLERNEASSYGAGKVAIQETFSSILVDLGNRVPADIDLLYHLCYGDFEPPPCGRADRHGGHGGVRQPRLAADRAAGAAHPHAGAAQPQRRRLFRAAAGARLATGDGAVPRAGAPHRRRRRHEAAAGNGAKIRRWVLHRDRMRLRPPRSRHDPRAPAHPCGGGGHGVDRLPLTTRWRPDDQAADYFAESWVPK